MVRLMILSCVLFAAAQIPSAAQTALSPSMASNPAAENRDQLMWFGQFVGDWSFDSVEYQDDGSRPTQKGGVQFRWVLHGTAVQDVWLETERCDGERKMNGTTVRFYDPNGHMADHFYRAWPQRCGDSEGARVSSFGSHEVTK